ncbi:MAG TPA: formylglycine-generating enzyme family protein, partial [Vicinamibacterales bacterium]|nr:formylglycine-generating enzyme family protein [Vicinamibacterales bacterium]
MTRPSTALFGCLLAVGGCGSQAPGEPPGGEPVPDLVREAPGPAPDGMVWIPGGRFTMGSDGLYASAAERPPHDVIVDGFFMAARTVTNAEFRAFVDATGYVTVAERDVDAEAILRQVPAGTPPPPPDMLVPGSLVFTPAPHVTSLDDWSRWWRWTPGANWRQPGGPGTSLEGQDAHPVVQVAWDDAVAYARWKGARLPTEAEWEYAARGGLDGAEHAWGAAPLDPAHPQAHIYEGVFPTHAAGPKPVGSHAPNASGLYDMSGNVWQWTADWFRPDAYAADHTRGLVRNPTGPDRPDTRPGAMAARVLRGGSFLCSDTYCRGYRVSARSPAAP